MPQQAISTFIDGLNRILKEHHLNLVVKADDFHFLDKVVTDALKERKVSRFLTNQLWPVVKEIDFYHYTNAAAAQAILDEEALRLTSILGRIKEEEIIEFLETFGYEHPLSTNPETGKSRYEEELAPRVFYVSLTDASISSEVDSDLWTSFSKGTGARFQFRLKLGSGVLRRMTYGNQIDSLAKCLKAVRAFTKESLGKDFFWDDAPYVCHYHLPEHFEDECETRLALTKAWGLREKHPESESPYIEIPFGYDNRTSIDLQLVEVQSDQPLLIKKGIKLVERSI